MSPQATPSDNDRLTELGRQIDEVERSSTHHFDPGLRAVLIAGAVLLLLIAGALPWLGSTMGWQVLFGHAIEQKVGGIAPRVFLAAAGIFGVLGSLVALSVRRYGAAWIASLGSDLSVLFGGLSVWSQQSTPSHQPGPGPGVGMILALVAMIALAILWAGVVWKKPADLRRIADQD